MTRDYGRSGADAPSGLRRFAVEPPAASQAEPLVPNALPACEACSRGHTGLPGGACENCMNTGVDPNALRAVEREALSYHWGVEQMLAYEQAGGDGWWKGWETLRAAYARASTIEARQGEDREDHAKEVDNG